MKRLMEMLFACTLVLALFAPADASAQRQVSMAMSAAPSSGMVSIRAPKGGAFPTLLYVHGAEQKELQLGSMPFTIGRKTGGITGMTVRNIHSGLIDA